jgi:hypothetical protein
MESKAKSKGREFAPRASSEIRKEVAPSSVVSSPPESPTPLPRPRRPRLQMLADRALEDEAGDRLDFKAYADALAGLIDNPETGTPLTIAIHGPWGAGKSTLAQMVKRRLESKPAAGGNAPHVTCWFNAWMHDDAADLAAAFAAELARSADRLRPLWLRLLGPLPAALRPPGERLRRRILAGIVALLLAALLTFVYTHLKDHQLQVVQDCVSKLLKIFGDKSSKDPDVNNSAFFSLVSGLLLLFPHLFTVARSVSDFVRDPKAPATTGSMEPVRTQLGDLIQQATPAGSRFVVFVDDLERCRPPRSVDVLEVINQLLCHPNVVVLVMADMTAVAACAEIKYKKLANIYSPESGGLVKGVHDCNYGRLYLQKIVQLQFDLPPLRTEKIRGLLDNLAGIGATEPALVKAAPARRTAVPRPLPGLLGVALRAWRGPYCEDLWQAVHRRPWPWAVVAAPRELALFPERCMALLGSRVAYSPAALQLHAEPGLEVRGWRFAGELSAAFYPPFLVAAALSWPAYFLPWHRIAIPIYTVDLTWAGPIAALFALLAAAMVGVEAVPGWKTDWLRRVFAGGLALWLTAAAWTSALLIRDQWTPWAPSLSRVWLFSFPCYLGIAAGCVALTAFFAYRKGHSQRRLDLKEMLKVRDVIREAIEQGRGEKQQIEERLRERGHFHAGWEALTLEGLQLHFFNESDLLREAEAEVMPFLPPLPRSAKRILNHLRLLLFIADARKVFGGQPEISAGHFGKWVVLQERWPDVARAVAEAPSEMARLESLAESPELFFKKVEQIAPRSAQDPNLKLFCAETKLAGVVERLLHFDSGTAGH